MGGRKRGRKRWEGGRKMKGRRVTEEEIEERKGKVIEWKARRGGRGRKRKKVEVS